MFQNFVANLIPIKFPGHVLGPLEVDPRPLHRLPVLLLPRVDRQLTALRPRRYKGRQKLPLYCLSFT